MKQAMWLSEFSSLSEYNRLNRYSEPPLNAYTDIIREDRRIILGLGISLLPYFMYARSKGFDETANMRRFV